LVESVVPVICAARGIEDPTNTIKEFLAPASEQFQDAVDETLRNKLGLFLPHQKQAGDDLWETLEPLMHVSRVDWTLFFRQLSYVAGQLAVASKDKAGNVENGAVAWTGSRMLDALEGGSRDPKENVGNPFYERLDDDTRQKFEAWLERWSVAMLGAGGSVDAAAERMLRTNPKFVLREWMMVDAYSSAQRGEEAELLSLYSLIQRPYDEGSDHESSRFYRRAPDEALDAGGSAFMS
jgi:uncharacterized protein YdiU (UPF0061 family)